MIQSSKAYIGLGSNLGNRQENVKAAISMLADNVSIELCRVSDTVETEALGDAEQPKYLNAVVEIKTTLSPQQLLETILSVETSLGRTRGEKWAPRTIDLDLLLFDDEIIETPNLILPHPQMHLRSFVLKGLCQFNLNMVHPVLKKSMQILAQRLNGCDFVLNCKQPQLISVAGLIGVGKTTLTQKLCAGLKAQSILEPYDQNPFMPEVYAGKKELALDSQLYFLANRVKQLAPDSLHKHQLYITDYIFEKELIYANQTLNQQQLALYKEICRSLSQTIAKPVLVLYLIGSAQNCLERIQKRNRPYEQGIQESFLQNLKNSYENLFDRWQICPVIRLSTSEFDCTKESDLIHLTNQTKNYVVV